MADKIKSFAEYKELVREYNESDSVSRRESIKDVVYNTAKALLHKLIALYAKYGQRYVYDSDFGENSGELSLNEFDESTVVLHYEDHWAYGGECDIIITVQMKYLDSDEMKVLEKELREKRVACVKNLVKEKKDTIERLKKEVEKLEVELEELETHGGN